MATWHLSGPAANAQTQSPSPPALSGPSQNIPDKKLQYVSYAAPRVRAREGFTLHASSAI
jgi:hypothetical protein